MAIEPLLIFGAICYVGLQTPPPPLPEKVASDASRVIRELYSAPTYPEMLRIAAHWRDTLSPALRKQVTLQLLRDYDSDARLELKGSPTVLIAGVDKVHIKPGVVVLTVNVYTKGGRAGWGLWQLLDIDVSSSSPRDPQERRNRDHLFVYRSVLEVMDWPVNVDYRLPQLSRDAKLKLVSARTTPALLLSRLCEDSDAQVRLALAEDPSIPLIVLGHLFDDENASVRAAAVRNLFEGDLKRPGGWQRQDHSKQAEAEIRNLLEATEFSSVRSVIDKWRAKLSFGEKAQVVVRLLDRFQSERVLILDGLVKTNEVGKKAFDTNISGARKEGGRAAWATAELLKIQITTVSKDATPEDRFRAHKSAYETVIDAMDWPVGRDFSVAKLDDTAKVQLAAMRALPGPVMMRLAREPSAKIRLAVAKHPRATITVLQKLRFSDTDPEVRKAAEKNRLEAGANRPFD